MEPGRTVFWIVVLVVLSFGVTVVAGKNGLLSARCAARCLTEHKDDLSGCGLEMTESTVEGGPGKERRNVHLLAACENHPVCSVCMKPCDVSVDELGMCEKFCEKIEPVCIQSCRFLASAYSWKGGVCPDPRSARGFDAACVKTCSLDGDCPENQKCCFNGCGHTCVQPVYNNSRGLPPKPYNISVEERQKGRAVMVTWSCDYKGQESGLRGQFVYLLEQRNTTTLKPNWDEPPQWQFVTQTQQTGVLLRRIHAGHWYQFRVIAVNSNGTRGFSPLSPPFKSSRDVRPPQAPRNLTEGVTTLKNGRVDVTVHWEPPKFSDLPIWKYMILWSERLSSASPILIKLDVLQRALPGNQHEFKLKSLKPGTTYFVEMEAIVQKINSKGGSTTRLRSPKTNLTFTTYSPSEKKEKEFGDITIPPAIVKIKNLRAGKPYFDKGVLKAHISWQIIKDYRKMVKSFMIDWSPRSCAQNYQSSSNLWATCHETHFELYDLLYECDYDVKVKAVTHNGMIGKDTAIMLRTPLCGDIAVKGGSLPPQCPERVINPPRAISSIAPFTSNINCSIEVRLTWKPPQSDLPIQQYHLKWWLSEKVQVLGTNSDQHLYRREAIDITLPNVSTEYIMRGLNNSEHYVIELYAVSVAGPGKSVNTEIWTPAVIPCKPDKEPEPPDKMKSSSERTTKAAILPSSNKTASSSTLPPSLPPSSSKNIVPVDRTLQTTSTSIITLATKLPPPTPPGKPSQNNPPKIPDIYSIVYYLFFFISEWLKKHFS